MAATLVSAKLKLESRRLPIGTVLSAPISGCVYGCGFQDPGGTTSCGSPTINRSMPCASTCGIVSSSVITRAATARVVNDNTLWRGSMGLFLSEKITSHLSPSDNSYMLTLTHRRRRTLPLKSGGCTATALHAGRAVRMKHPPHCVCFTVWPLFSPRRKEQWT